MIAGFFDGVLFGLAVGIPQWLVLRRYVLGAIVWIPVTLMGFAMSLTLLGIWVLTMEPPGMIGVPGLVAALTVPSLGSGIALDFLTHKTTEAVARQAISDD